MKMTRERTAPGIGLLELLIALSIVALLLSYAVPSWREHLRKARRTDAMAILMHAATRQEQFRLVNRRYAGSDELFLAPPAGLGITADNESYSFGSQSGPDSFVLSATAKSTGPQADDERCSRLAIDETGRRTAIDSSGSDTSGQCWPVR